MSKMQSLEDGQTRMYLQFNERMDRQNEIFINHVEDDKKLAEQFNEVRREVTFAKGVAYVLSGGTAFAAWMTGHFK